MDANELNAGTASDARNVENTRGMRMKIAMRIRTEAIYVQRFSNRDFQCFLMDGHLRFFSFFWITYIVEQYIYSF